MYMCVYIYIYIYTHIHTLRETAVHSCDPLQPSFGSALVLWRATSPNINNIKQKSFT